MSGLAYRESGAGGCVTTHVTRLYYMYLRASACITRWAQHYSEPRHDRRGVRSTMPRPSDPGQGPQRERKQIVHRRCRVCEWEAEQIESEGADFDCPWCHAPTFIASVLPQAGPPEPADHPKNPHATALGRLGGLKGGPARAARLTPRERRESARQAALARWAKKGQRRSR